MATHVSDGSSADVQDIHDNDAAEGDTITIPAGSFTWTTTVTITKGIILEGAGATLSHITDEGSGGAAILATCSDAHFVRITGLEFIKGTSHGGGMVQFLGPDSDGTEEVGFRIDHCAFTFPTIGSRAIFPTGIFGLIDHNTFTAQAAGSQQSISCEGSSTGSDGGFGPWTRPLSLGTNKAVFIEDNIFDYTLNDQSEDSIDMYAGARIVIRHNMFLSCTQGFHGTDSGGARSPVSFEIYENTYTNDSLTTIRACTVRGGTGVIYSNTYGGSHGSWHEVALQYHRAYSQQSDWEQCDGTVWQLGSTDTSTGASRTCSVGGGVGFSSIDNETLGTFGGEFTRGFDGAGALGYPGRDQPGIEPGQVASPIYVWDQTNDPGVAIWAGAFPPAPEAILLAEFLQSGREWIEGTEKPGYEAYVYPHPLQDVDEPEPGTSPVITGAPVY